MDHHRFREPLAPPPLPPVAPPPVTPTGFIVCPGIVCPAALLPGVLSLYQWALQLALAVHQPSLPERAMAASWN
jgi:hypothetical protein